MSHLTEASRQVTIPTKLVSGPGGRRLRQAGELGEQQIGHILVRATGDTDAFQQSRGCLGGPLPGPLRTPATMPPGKQRRTH